MSLLCVFAGCKNRQPETISGYVEGQYLYMASPFGGTLETLFVKRGDQVKVGDPLFALDSVAETASLRQAAQRVAEGNARLEDTKKGQRQTEVAAIQAQLEQNRAALVLSEKEFIRQKELFQKGASAAQEMDQARARRDQDRQQVAKAEADLKTARLGSRSDLVAAAEANVQALTAALAKAAWELSQKQLDAPQAALVFDTLYRPGEFIAASHPVVSLLPPGNIKVRAFVPETRIATIHAGDSATVSMDGKNHSLQGRVSFISPQAEYTPPVIYSQKSRGKLVFLIEIVFTPEVAAGLHPGQPVDVTF